MQKVQSIVRILFGLMLLVFGLNGFFQFMPMPPMAPEAQNFMEALVQTHYMMPFISVVKIIGALLLLSNRYVPLALIIVFPVILNAFLFHLFLDINGIGGAVFALFMNIYLFFTQKQTYRPLFAKQ